MTGSGEEPWPPADPEADLAAFRRAARGRAVARFAPDQAAIVRSLVSQVAELVGGDEAGGERVAGAGPAGGGPAGGGLAGDDERAAQDDLAAQLGLTDHAELPADPILARLLPDAYSDDPEAAGEFRRYTEVSLRSGKVAAAQAVLDTLPARGGKVALSTEQAGAWLRALNDVRLSLGVILGVTDDFDDQLAELTPDDPRAAYVGVYQWLAILQESLVEALT